ncbi:MAG TPA: hypothetical protein [Caudoviricetes sp.]|nr:MAG TPA: hypothetical protein [Caudoviricetes sp.]
MWKGGRGVWLIKQILLTLVNYIGMVLRQFGVKMVRWPMI